MATEIHDGANGNLKKTEVEPLGELKDKAEPTKPVDLCNAGDANGKFDKSGCESRAEKDEPITMKATIKSGPQTIPKQKGVVHDVEGEEEDVEEPQDDNDYKSEEEEEDGEGEEDEREVDGEPYEEEDEEEYVEDGDEDEGDDDESEPPSKRRK